MAENKTKVELEEEIKFLKAKLEATELKNGKMANNDSDLKRQQDYLNELVEIKLFKDSDKYKDDVYISINGKNTVIKRGVAVKIPRKYKMILDAAETQSITAENVKEANLYKE